MGPARQAARTALDLGAVQGPMPHAGDLFKRALAAAGAGDHAMAAGFYRQVLAQRPDHFNAQSFLGTSLRELGDLAGAIASYGRAVELRPQNAEVRVHLAEALRRAGENAAAVAHCDDALRRDHRLLDGYVVRAMARKGLGDIDGAIRDLREAERLKGGVPAMRLLAGVLIDDGRKHEALTCLEAILAAAPDDADATRLAADCYYAIGMVREASAAYSRAIDLNPSDALAFSNLSGLLCFTGQLDMGLAAASIAVRLDPSLSGAHFNMGLVHEAKGDYPQAVGHYAGAVTCQPDFGIAHVAISRLRRHDCDWAHLEDCEELAQTLTYERGIGVAPFGILPMTGSPQRLLACNVVWAEEMMQAATPPLSTYAPRPPERRGERLRIGYLSADFLTHATMHLIAELFELHDRTRFETFGYSIGNQDSGDDRRRLENGLEHFTDLNALSHVEAAARIRQDEIDILVDLKGYTFQARPQILACRPAPIQVNYLGYPGTMGAPFIDYIVGDAVVTPFDHASFFSEKIVQLPNSYQPNDRKRRIADLHFDRTACGLPEDGFVFCCFNGNYKLNAAMFDVWVRLLNAVPGSVLWLLESNARTPQNLRREAQMRGVDPRRLVFAPRLPADQHLARMRLGDLFLDTAPVGAHTTASEALWVGLPVVTCLGDAFPARVGASLLAAMDMKDLVAADMAGYEAIALRLAERPDQFADIRQRLLAARDRAPLFDSKRYAGFYEAALLRMAALRDDAMPPQAFAIDPDATRFPH